MKKEVKMKLPEGWSKSKLAELGKYINGKAFKPEDWDLEGTPIIRIENLSDEKARFNYYKGECEDRYKINNGDLLVSWSATLDAFIWNRGKAYLNQHIFKVVPFEHKANKNFLYFLLRYSMNELRGEIHGATMQHITKPKFDNFEVAHPVDTNIQYKISQELERKVNELEKMKQAVLMQKDAISAMRGAVLREIFPRKERDKLPAGWKWEKLSVVCFLNPRRDRSVPRDGNALTSFVPMEAIDERKGMVATVITRKYSEVSKGYTFFANGDVLFAKITPCMQNGKSAIAENLIDGIGFGSTEFHVFRPKEGTLKEWIYYFVRTPEFRKRAEEHFTGSAGQQRVPTDFLEEALIPVPPRMDDQIRIIAKLKQKVNELEKMSDVVVKKLEAIKAMQGAILQDVFGVRKVNN